MEEYLNELLAKWEESSILKPLIPGQVVQVAPMRKRKLKKLKDILTEFDPLRNQKLEGELTSSSDNDFFKKYFEETGTNETASPDEQQFIDLDILGLSPVRIPAAPWIDILNDAKDEFEVDGATAVFSTWRVKVEDPLDIGDIYIADGMKVRAGRMAFDARMTDERAAQVISELSEGKFVLNIKFLRENEDRYWDVEYKFDQSGLK